MYAGPYGGHWVLYAVYACACWYPVLITGGQWVDLCVNQGSGIDHHHPRVSMHVGSAHAWKACMGRSELHHGYQ